MNKLNHFEITVKRTEPVIWVGRIVIYESTKPLTEIRTIELKRGVNIVWAEEVEDDTSVGSVEVTGHSAGKTTFCRLLRYCLGESSFGTKNNQKLIRAAFPQGYIAAEIHVKGETWAVARPIGNSRSSFAAKDVSIEELFKKRPGIESYQVFQKAIENAMLAGLSPKTIVRTGQPIKFEHILAWCTRDQEARFQDIWQWRSQRSESETLGFEKPKIDVFYIMRAVLGLLIEEEVQYEKTLDDFGKHISENEKQIEAHKHEQEYWRKHYTHQLKKILKIDLEKEIPLRSTDLFSEDLINQVDAEKKRLAAEVNKLDVQIAKLNERITDLSIHINSKDLQNNFQRHILSVTEAKIAELQNGTIEQQGKDNELKGLAPLLCDYGEILIQNCTYAQAKFTIPSISKTADARHIKKEEERLKETVVKVRSKLAESENEANELRVERKKPIEELQRLTQYRYIQAKCQEDLSSNLISLQEISEILENKKTDNTIVELRNKIEKLKEQIKNTQVKLSELLKCHEENRDQLLAIFNATVKEVLSKDYSGLIRLDSENFSFHITHGAALAGEAMETLAILLADVSCMIFAITGKGSFPGFLLHDSPREADLEGRIYRSFIKFLVSLQQNVSNSENYPFQYIITTTTPPPKELQNEQFLKLKLNSAQESGLLLRRNITLTQNVDLGLFSE